MTKQVLVPDIGDAEDVSVIEILVKVGDLVAADDSLVVLESEKASMEIPSPTAGRIVSITIGEGDEVDEGDLLLEMEEAGSAEVAIVEVPEPSAPETPSEPSASEPSASEPSTSEPAASQPAAGASIETVLVPDVGDAKDIVVTEILVKPGDQISEEDSILVLESDKASMEVPAPLTGEVLEILVAEGAEVSEGDPLIRVSADAVAAQTTPEVSSAQAADTDADTVAPDVRQPAADREAVASGPSGKQVAETVDAEGVRIYAGPAVRKQARELGVQLTALKGTGRNGRILKEDVKGYVKQRIAAGSGDASTGIPSMPVVDFSRYGEVEHRPLARIRQISARNLHRSWLNVPHVTQFDEADVTELEDFRRAQNAELARDADAAGIKLTPLAFIIRACVGALQKFPQFNSSIAPDFSELIIKRYINIGIAVETDDGLVVPVVKAADTRGVIELARESSELAQKARDKKLPMDAIQGATFTISSLGGIGGTAFTPIVNAPEVAILGVSRSRVLPQYDGAAFVPRTMLPLSLSYDHRAIDGAEAARFTAYLGTLLADVRRLIL